MPADRCTSLSALCVGRDIDEEIEWDCGKDDIVQHLKKDSDEFAGTMP